LPDATPKNAEPALVVFARAPVPGRVKTRLVPLLGKKGAARLHERMLAKTLRTAKASGFETKLLLASSQGPGNLGERMHRAFAQALKEHERVILIGSDCPALKASDLRAAARALQKGASAVLAPAEDGGYALIGLKRNSRRLFSRIEWGGPKVMAQTRRRLKALRWRWTELRTLWDVDRPEDVRRLRRERLL
jgi:rSAM/selenodomain-associated transferase 1